MARMKDYLLEKQYIEEFGKNWEKKQSSKPKKESSKRRILK